MFPVDHHPVAMRLANCSRSRRCPTTDGDISEIIVGYCIRVTSVADQLSLGRCWINYLYWNLPLSDSKLRFWPPVRYSVMSEKHSFYANIVYGRILMIPAIFNFWYTWVTVVCDKRYSFTLDAETDLTRLSETSEINRTFNATSVLLRCNRPDTVHCRQNA